MQLRFDSFSIPRRLAAQRVHGTPSFLAQGVVASVATHALLLGGYSLYLACVSMWPEFFTPQWYPPQSGVFSRARVASQAIVIEAAFERRTVRQDGAPVRIHTQPADQSAQAAALEAQATHLVERAETDVSRPRPLDFDPAPVLEPWMLTRPAQPHQELDPQTPTSDQQPSPAHVPRRSRLVSFHAVTSVASTATRKSDGAESEVPPRTVFNPAPIYPDAENAAGIGGLVKIYVRLSVGGKVEVARVQRSSGIPALDEAALAAVRRWRFEPLSSDRPTAREVIVRTRFAPAELPGIGPR